MITVRAGLGVRDARIRTFVKLRSLGPGLSDHLLVGLWVYRAFGQHIRSIGHSVFLSINWASV